MKTQFLLSLMIFPVLLFSQGNWGGGGNKGPKIVGNISGTLLDETNKAPVEYATIALSKKDSDKIINSAMTDDKGDFKMTDVKPGEYKITASFIGYSDLVVQEVVTTLKKPDFKVGDIMIKQDNVVLDEVEVTSKRALIENKIDKIVYNAEDDNTNAGGSAEDVMRKVPMVSVDLEGNVSLRGSRNIRVLINGKPSTMFATNVADAMKMIPSDEIKNVEVITNPSAKYDGEGTAGIINIITKKKKIDGFSGTLRSSIGTRQNNLNLSLNLNKGRFGFNAGGYTYFSWPQDAEFEFLRENFLPGGQKTIYAQSGITNTQRIGGQGRFGAFYDFNAYTSLNTSFSLRGFTNSSEGITNSSFTDESGTIPNFAFDRFNDQNSLFGGYNWATDLTRKFENPDQELTFAVQLDGNTNDRDNITRQTTEAGILAFDENTINDGDNLEITLQVDYTHPFSKKVKLEIGAKTVLRDIDSQYDYDLLDPDLNVYNRDLERSNLFGYDQDVYAGYASFNFTLNDKTSIIAGARYEATEIAGEFERDFDPFSNSYNNFLPNVILSRKLGNFSTIKFAYSQRIQRPSLFYINPYVADQDRLNISFGNPELDPELSNLYELSYNTFVKGISINASVYYRNTDDAIESLLRVEDGISKTSFANLGTRNTVGVNLFTSFSPIKIWTIRAGINVWNFDIQSDNPEFAGLERNGFMYNGNVFSSLTLPKDWSIDMFTFFNSPRETAQGRNPAFSMLGMGIKKLIWKKKGSIGINIIEPFVRVKNFESELSGPDFYQYSNFGLPFQSFGINFSYSFGKLDFSQRKSKIKNNDMKEGGDAQNQGF